MIGFLQPLALLAFPLALLPLLLARRRRRRGEPERFSSLHLFDEAARRPAPRTGRNRRQLLLRILAIALLVLAAARPTGPGRGGASAHRPTRVVVAVDVSASVGQGDGERTAWASVRAWADSLLALTGPGDRVALAAVADGVVGWWTGEPTALRRRLSGLEPTARASDWPRVLAALEARAGDDTETYLLTDGSRGARPPSLSASSGARSGYRALRVWERAGARNRALSGCAGPVPTGSSWSGACGAGTTGPRWPDGGSGTR